MSNKCDNAALSGVGKTSVLVQDEFVLTGETTAFSLIDPVTEF